MLPFVLRSSSCYVPTDSIILFIIFSYSCGGLSCGAHYSQVEHPCPAGLSPAVGFIFYLTVLGLPSLRSGDVLRSWVGLEVTRRAKSSTDSSPLKYYTIKQLHPSSFTVSQIPLTLQIPSFILQDSIFIVEGPTCSNQPASLKSAQGFGFATIFSPSRAASAVLASRLMATQAQKVFPICFSHLPRKHLKYATQAYQAQPNPPT